MSDQPKPAGEPECCWCGQEMSKHDMSHDAKAMPPQPQPKPTGEQKAVAMTRVCLWRLREECRAIEDVTGKDSVPAYLRRCVKHLSIFERPIMSDQPKHTTGEPEAGYEASIPKSMQIPTLPTTTGEWTVHQWKDGAGNLTSSYEIHEGDKLIVADLLKEECEQIADAHNAAISVEREQLAAEREKVQTLVAALKEIRGLLTLANRKIQIIDAALEKAMK